MLYQRSKEEVSSLPVYQGTSSSYNSGGLFWTSKTISTRYLILILMIVLVTFSGLGSYLLLHDMDQAQSTLKENVHSVGKVSSIIKQNLEPPPPPPLNININQNSQNNHLKNTQNSILHNRNYNNQPEQAGGLGKESIYEVGLMEEPESTSSEWFECFDNTGKTLKFPRRYLNDDYCDCPDGADEPLTSACSHLPPKINHQPKGHFLCVQEKRYLFESHVNDGVCDCCDGSDEWTHREWGRRVSCHDTCSLFKAEMAKKQLKTKQGELMRLDYVKQGGKQRYRAEYGEDAAFFPLTQAKQHGHRASKKAGCFSINSGEYVYEICFFQGVTQKKKNGGTNVNLGNKYRWIQPNKEGLFSQGTRCPGNIGPRQTRVLFSCSDVEELLSVIEQSNCQYEMQVATPAACVII